MYTITKIKINYYKALLPIKTKSKLLNKRHTSHQRGNIRILYTHTQTLKTTKTFSISTQTYVHEEQRMRTQTSRHRLQITQSAKLLTGFRSSKERREMSVLIDDYVGSRVPTLNFATCSVSSLCNNCSYDICVLGDNVN
jgi:hypothetical protein